MDWDNDGNLDILSGCYWTSGKDGGFIQILKGNGSLDFAEAVALMNSAGEPLQNAVIEKADGSSMASNQTQTICTHQHAVDYDGDGDLDLVNGCFGPEFFLYENTGENQISDKPILLPIKSTSHHAAPHLVDWDGDGDLDLLSGTAEGGVILSINDGSRSNPVWTEFQQLIEAPRQHQQSTADGQEISPSPGTRVWAYDWNRDGLLDLLVGDHASVVNRKPGVSKEEYQELLAENSKQMNSVQAKYQDVYEEYSKAREAGEVSDDLKSKLSKASTEMRKVSGARKEFEDSRSTGFVWLYLRKSAQKVALRSAGESNRS